MPPSATGGGCASPASSCDDDETLAHARERLLAAIRLRAPLEPPRPPDDEDDLFLDEVPVPTKRRRLQKTGGQDRTSRPVATSESCSDSSDDDSSDECDSSDLEVAAGANEEETAAEEGPEEEEDPYVRLGLRKPTPAAPLLSAAAATGAAWAYCTAQSRPAWSTSQLAEEEAERERRANDQSLAAIESELALSRHEGPSSAPPVERTPHEPRATQKRGPTPVTVQAAATMATDTDAADQERLLPVHDHPHSGGVRPTRTPPSAAAALGAVPLARHAAAASQGVGGGRIGGAGTAAAASGGLRTLMQANFPARPGLNPTIRGATFRQAGSGPSSLREATGSAGLQALAKRHGWKLLPTSGGATASHAEDATSSQSGPSVSRQFLAAARTAMGGA